jgi:hypothetical protein
MCLVVNTHLLLVIPACWATVVPICWQAFGAFDGKQEKGSLCAAHDPTCVSRPQNPPTAKQCRRLQPAVESAAAKEEQQQQGTAGGLHSPRRGPRGGNRPWRGCNGRPPPPLPQSQPSAPQARAGLPPGRGAGSLRPREGAAATGGPPEAAAGAGAAPPAAAAGAPAVLRPAASPAAHSRPVPREEAMGQQCSGDRRGGGGGGGLSALEARTASPGLGACVKKHGAHVAC